MTISNLMNMVESSPDRVENAVEKGDIAHYEQFLAPLAEGQRAIVMAWGRRPSVRPFVRACVRKLFL